MSDAERVKKLFAGLDYDPEYKANGIAMLLYEDQGNKDNEKED